jgi:hypothetical protein
MGTGRQRIIATAAGRVAVAGTVGVLAMTVGEKVEQRFTGRTNSYVPARALMVMTGRQPGDDESPVIWNHAMHWGTGALLGALRGVWSATGIRGVEATSAHAVVRLAFDQTAENVTGVGAPPATWPLRERTVDYALKGIYALVTGLVADRWIPSAATVRRAELSH